MATCVTSHSDYGCCLTDIPDQAEEGAVWDCELCGTRWVWMVDGIKKVGAWYRSKLAGMKRSDRGRA